MDKHFIIIDHNNFFVLTKNIFQNSIIIGTFVSFEIKIKLNEKYLFLD